MSNRGDSNVRDDRPPEEPRPRPYLDSVDHLLDELRHLDLLLERRVESWWAETGGEPDEFRGLYVSDEAVERLVRPATARPTPDDDADADRRAAVRRLARAIADRRAASADAGVELRLARLGTLFGLDARERDALLIALAPDVASKYETLYSYLQDDVTRTRATVEFVLELLCGDDEGDEHERLTARDLFDRTGPLVRHRLVSLPGRAEDGPLRSRPVVVDERVVEYVLGGDDVDPELAGVVSLDTARRGVRRSWLPADVRGTLDRVVGRPGAPPPMVAVAGPDGAGKRAVAESVSTAAGTPLLTLDAARIAADGDDDRFVEVLDRTRREALFRDASLLVTDLDARSEFERRTVVDRLDAAPAAVVLAGAERWRPPRPPDAHEFVGVTLSVPGYETRRAIWTDALGDAAATVDVAGLAAKFRLTPGVIVDAVATARTLSPPDADGGAGELTTAALYRACRELSGRRLGALASKTTPRYGWDDIVLPDSTYAALRDVTERITHRGTVYDEWGFDAKHSLGKGLVVLFTGPSGTGKTMAAEIIAREAGLDLYRIDLANVISKYIGETEKNLGEVFDAAEATDAILLFDEADALFGKRTEIRDAHDRYANVEVDYLLQRIEAHDGTVVLTTNLKQNVDDAFMRRIHAGVEFQFPTRDLRASIWRNVFPESTPLGDVDVAFLSSLEFAGGNIKNVALTAAFRAAADGGRVEMTHLVDASRREFQKTGKLVDPDAFGEYRSLLT